MLCVAAIVMQLLNICSCFMYRVIVFNHYPTYFGFSARHAVVIGGRWKAKEMCDIQCTLGGFESSPF